MRWSSSVVVQVAIFTAYQYVLLCSIVFHPSSFLSLRPDGTRLTSRLKGTISMSSSLACSTERDRQRLANFADVMQLNTGVSSPALYLGGVEDLSNLGLVNKDLSTFCRNAAFLTDMIRNNWTRLLKPLFVHDRFYKVNILRLPLILEAHDSLMAGPFALQCVTGDDCGCLDNMGAPMVAEMHVYCTTSGFRAVSSLFVNIGYVQGGIRELDKVVHDPFCFMLCLKRLKHTVVLIRMCLQHSPRNALKQFQVKPAVMRLRDDGRIWFRDNDTDATPRLVFCNAVAPLCYAFIR